MISSQAKPLHDPRGVTYRQTLILDKAVNDTHPNMMAQRKEDFFSVQIDEDLVQQEIQELQNILIGRVSMAPGESPYSLEDLKMKLEQVWGISGNWNLISMFSYPIYRIKTKYWTNVLGV